jgi:glycosyltransferase involved in cell wall biosynthesis
LKPDVTRFLNMGTPSHQPDLEFLGEVFHLLKRKCRNRVELDVIGITARKSDWYEVITVPHIAAHSYPRFVSWLRALDRGWAWGLAPLLDTAFNNSKTPIKVLEYSALGLPSICSKLSVYASTVVSGSNGLLVENDVQAWCDTLERAAVEPAFQRQIHQEAMKIAAANTIGANADAIRRVWDTVLKASPTRSLVASVALSSCSPDEQHVPDRS